MCVYAYVYIRAAAYIPKDTQHTHTYFDHGWLWHKFLKIRKYLLLQADAYDRSAVRIAKMPNASRKLDFQCLLCENKNDKSLSFILLNVEWKTRNDFVKNWNAIRCIETIEKRRQFATTKTIVQFSCTWMDEWMIGMGFKRFCWIVDF